MDRKTALEILDSVRPGSDDLHEPEVRAAAEHLAGDPECEAVFLSRQHFDREIGHTLRDVPVPDDLRERLLALEAASSEGIESPAAGGTPTTSPPIETTTAARVSRRKWAGRVVAAVAAAAAIVVGIGVWQSAGHSSLTVAELERSSPFDANPVPFAGDFRPQLPFEFAAAQHRGVLNLGRPRAAGGMPAAAVFDFRLPTRRRSRETIEGALLVLPASAVADAPRHPSFQEAPSSGYFQSAGGGYTAVSWTSHDFVYVCYVKGGDDALQQLRRALTIAPA